MNYSSYQIFSENICKVMNQRNLTQQELATMASLTRQTISNATSVYNSEQKSIRLSSAVKIAKALNLDFPSLFVRFDVLKNQYDTAKTYDNYRKNFINKALKILRNRGLSSLSID